MITTSKWWKCESNWISARHSQRAKASLCCPDKSRLCPSNQLLSAPALDFRNPPVANVVGQWLAREAAAKERKAAEKDLEFNEAMLVGVHRIRTVDPLIKSKRPFDPVFRRSMKGATLPR